ncbi:hypothetical protein EYF80_017686 [Liparis tanakae]|uniref:Uncharacterized protein n=1 Tax=Liparis tanakae TaxID=230148 RepID=A0A4Z2I1Z9_9TELE|nr:hypothetical protein EYF80_017686 [Liparis tanakae]
MSFKLNLVLVYSITAETQEDTVIQGRCLELKISLLSGYNSSPASPVVNPTADHLRRRGGLSPDIRWNGTNVARCLRRLNRRRTDSRWTPGTLQGLLFLSSFSTLSNFLFEIPPGSPTPFPLLFNCNRRVRAEPSGGQRCQESKKKPGLRHSQRERDFLPAEDWKDWREEEREEMKAGRSESCPRRRMERSQELGHAMGTGALPGMAAVSSVDVTNLVHPSISGFLERYTYAVLILALLMREDSHYSNNHQKPLVREM